MLTFAFDYDIIISETRYSLIFKQARVAHILFIGVHLTVSKFLGFLRKYALALVVSIAGLAVVGVGYFDTYPTYLAKEVTLSQEECSQVAVLVAAWQSSRNGEKAIPPAAQKVLDESTRLAKRVAKYIIEKSEIPEGVPAGMVYQALFMNCVGSEGKATLK